MNQDKNASAQLAEMANPAFEMSRNDDIEASVASVDVKLEVIVIPRFGCRTREEFYKTLGWRLDQLASFSDPDGNTWLLQEITTRYRGGLTLA